MQPMMAAYYPGNVTTDHIQQYLDENKSLILKIVESQNSGKMSECQENQVRLQRNLMYLAAIADSQPQPPTMHSQYPSGSMLQSGGHYLQQQQQMTPQSLMVARSSMLYGAQAYPSLQQQQQQQQQGMHSQLGMSSGGSSSGGLMLQGEPHTGGGFPDFIRGDAGMQRGMGSGSGSGSKHDIHMGSGDGRDVGETSLYLKSSEQDGH